MLSHCISAILFTQVSQQPVKAVLVTAKTDEPLIIDRSQFEKASKLDDGLYYGIIPNLTIIKNSRRLYIIDNKSTGLATLKDMTLFYRTSAKKLGSLDASQKPWTPTFDEAGSIINSYVTKYGVGKDVNQISNYSIEPQFILEGKNSSGAKVQFESDMKSSFKPTTFLHNFKSVKKNSDEYEFIVFPSMNLSVEVLGFQSSANDVADQMSKCLSQYWQLFENLKSHYNESYSQFVEKLADYVDKDLFKARDWEGQDLSLITERLRVSSRAFPFHQVSRQGYSSNSEHVSIRKVTERVVIYFTIEEQGVAPYVKGIVLPGKLP